MSHTYYQIQHRNEGINIFFIGAIIETFGEYMYNNTDLFYSEEAIMNTIIWHKFDPIKHTHRVNTLLGFTMTKLQPTMNK